MPEQDFDSYGESQVDLDLAGWDDVADARPTVPDGEYTIRFADPDLRQKQGASTYFISYTAIIQDGPNAGYPIYGGMWSLKPDQIWRFKRDLKNLEVEIPSGLSVKEAAENAVEQIDGLLATVLVNSRVRQIVDEDTGERVEDPEGHRENRIRRIVGLATF